MTAISGLTVGGLVARPQSLSIDDLRAMSARSQITRHDCVEGWSAIGQWKGVPLSAVLNVASLEHDAKFIVFYCADILESGADPYYESIDLIDAYHPQTMLAYELNGKALPIANGAPLRLRKPSFASLHDFIKQYPDGQGANLARKLLAGMSCRASLRMFARVRPLIAEGRA